MTTIATDGKTLACDSQRVAGSERIDLAAKKIAAKNGHVFAFTGDFGAFDVAVDWYLAGHKPDDAPRHGKDLSWRLLVLLPTHIMSYAECMVYGEPFAYPNAFGSGGNYALAALRCGKSPREAIEIASQLDIYTGGPIQVIDIKEALGLREPSLRVAKG